MILAATASPMYTKSLASLNCYEMEVRLPDNPSTPTDTGYKHAKVQSQPGWINPVLRADCNNLSRRSANSGRLIGWYLTPASSFHSGSF
jgi:hypothetical protein